MTGHNSIRMTDLALLYKDIGFTDAETYIQSGNVIFSAEDNLPGQDIATKIEKSILGRFNYNVPVMIRTVEDLRNILSANPFLTVGDFKPSKIAVIFLHEKTTENQIEKVVNIDYPPDKFIIRGSEIYLHCPNGFGRTKLYTNFFEKKMGVIGTARNLNTVTTILSLGEKSQGLQ